MNFYKFVANLSDEGFKLSVKACGYYWYVDFILPDHVRMSLEDKTITSADGLTPSTAIRNWIKKARGRKIFVTIDGLPKFKQTIEVPFDLIYDDNPNWSQDEIDACKQRD